MRVLKQAIVTGAVSTMLLVGVAPKAEAGIPVIDSANLVQSVIQAISWIQQLQQMQQQFEQLKQTHASFNKLTSMGDIASVLNRPEIRRALPNDYAAAQAALLGEGAEAHKSGDGIYVSPASDYYNAQINKQRDGIAGRKSVGQQLYDAASKRIDGIDVLRKQIGQSEDPKTIADLQARIQTEIAAANTEAVRMQALAMVIRAEEHREELRRGQAFEETLQKQIDALRRN